MVRVSCKDTMQGYYASHLDGIESLHLLTVVPSHQSTLSHPCRTWRKLVLHKPPHYSLLSGTRVLGTLRRLLSLRRPTSSITYMRRLCFDYAFRAVYARLLSDDHH